MTPNEGQNPSPIRILLLEDNPDDAELTLRKLKSAGLAVVGDVVRNAEDFKQRVRSRTHNLILCDFSLPGWNGLEALRWVRSSGFTIPFIYVSGTLGEDVAVDCLKEGATDYVIKGRLDRLPMSVRRALGEEQVLGERDRALQALRESEERFATAFHSTPEGITISRLPEDSYIEANEAFLKMIGYERSEVIGKAAAELNVWVDPKERLQLLEKLSSAKSVQGHEARFRARSGHIRQVEISAGKVQIQGLTCLLSVTRDVTELKLLKQQFLQSQKMEAVGKLAGGVAHDFNNILMIISGNCQLLSEKTIDPVKVAEYSKAIEDASGKAAALTRQLLAFSRKQVLQPTILNLNNVITDLWKMMPRLIGEDIVTELSLDKDLGTVSADPGQVEQIIMNLAVNARDAMPNGGRLFIQTSNVELDRGYCQKHGAAVPAGRYVMFSITDTGTGMTDEIQEQLFEPFFTTKEVGKGTGLGLATVYGIVKQSNGFIWVYSEPGRGSAFRVYLPRTKARASEVQEKSLVETGLNGIETILIVEDMAALRESTSEYLKLRGYTVLSASNGEEALEICRTHDKPIHILLTDLVMPGQSGFDVAQAALKIRPDLSIIYVSGYTDRAINNGILGAKAIFLQKPFSMNLLARHIRALLDDSGRAKGSSN